MSQEIEIRRGMGAIRLSAEELALLQNSVSRSGGLVALYVIEKPAPSNVGSDLASVAFDNDGIVIAYALQPSAIWVLVGKGGPL